MPKTTRIHGGIDAGRVNDLQDAGIVDQTYPRFLAGGWPASSPLGGIVARNFYRANSHPPPKSLMVLHKNESTGGVVVLRKFKAGYTIPAHTHPDANEWAYVLSGEWEESDSDLHRRHAVLRARRRPARPARRQNGSHQPDHLRRSADGGVVSSLRPDFTPGSPFDVRCSPFPLSFARTGIL